MSVQTADARPRSRGTTCPRLAFRCPSKGREQGMPDARCIRGLVCKMDKRKRTRAYRFSGGNPAFPARWFTAYSALSLVTGLSCHHRRWKLVSVDLTPASGRQDHTASPSALSAARLAPPKRPSHPAPNVRDDRDTPLLSRRDGREVIADLGVAAMPSGCGKLARRANYA